MRTLNASMRAEELHRLGILLEQALLESNELHHRIREIQLRVAELSAAEQQGRPVAVVSATALHAAQLSPR
ncbi:MAG TPA: hypothetical protein VG106_07160 [Vicinamibacterales bacterium]|nr:hypothetical protein [Vicinamibacterales bacterium]